MDIESALKLARDMAATIEKRRPDIRTHVSYLKGQEGRLKFASDEFKEYFQSRFEGFSDNWCLPVVQTPVERIHNLGVRLEGASSADLELRRVWDSNDADRGLSEALMLMTAAKRSFGLVSPSPAGPRITFEHPENAIVIYDPVTRLRRAGMVMWSDVNDQYDYGQLFVDGQVISVQRKRYELLRGERVATPATNMWTPSALTDDPVKSNPLGDVPLVEFRNQTLLDNDPMSDIDGVMSMQDTVNLVWAYQLNGLDYTSLPGRVVTGVDAPEEPILDDETGEVVGTRPIDINKLVRERIMFTGEGSAIDEWTPGSLDSFAKVIEEAVEHIAAQTRTPPHYLIAKMVNTSGDALTVAEAGLVSKTNERIGFATPPVREIYRLSALADGQPSIAKRVASGKVLWANTQHRSKIQTMDGLLKMRQAGFPLQFLAEEYGLDPFEVRRVMQMVRDEQVDPYLDALNAKGAVNADTDVAGSGEAVSAAADSGE